MKLIMTEAAKQARYSLELTESEAEILNTIVGRISGVGPGRKFVDDLCNALAKIKTADNKIIKFSGVFSK